MLRLNFLQPRFTPRADLESGPIVLIIRGAVNILFDNAPSSNTQNMLRKCGFASRFGTIWTGTKDGLFRAQVPHPPGHAAVWPDDWSSSDREENPSTLTNPDRSSST